jgi:uncharacterized protein (DUF58 family)
VLTTDFCPWANRFVYWLKEPVGWFVLATAVSVLIGLYFAPIGWTMAASLLAIIAVGMVWPWIAIRAVACSLKPDVDFVHEDNPCHLQMSVRNRLPLPIWGLAVEGYLDRTAQDDEESTVPTVALAYVRGFSLCTYRFAIRPALRGRYPESAATLTCSFPFGIWTARRTMREFEPVTVWPKVFPIAGQASMVGRERAECGEGNRSGRSGDFVGVREYRRGDCVRQVNWVATARTDSLIVTERGGPQCASLDVIVDAAAGRSREEIADRIRVAASVAANLHQSSMPVCFRIGGRAFIPRRGREGFAQIMDALTNVPADGMTSTRLPDPPRGTASITISSDSDGSPTVCMIDPGISHRLSAGHRHRVINRGDLEGELSSFWSEVRDANLVA